MTKEDIIRMAREAGLFIANDSEGHFSAVHDGEIHDLYPDPNQERDRLYKEKRFVEILSPFAALVAKHTLSNIDPSKFMSIQEGLEAGRVSEREACAKFFDDNDTNMFWGSQAASHIRARSKA